jgi:DNA-binding SARP family transcriptional activator
LTLRIRLLGQLDLRFDVGPLPPLESARAESLLAYLLLHRDAPQPRQHLAFLLWPDSSEAQARTNLRHVLHTLRHALPDPDQFLAVTPRTLQWRTDAPFWLDVAAFDELVARVEADIGPPVPPPSALPAAGGNGADGGSLAALREAVALYGGDLLEGCYDEWLLGERERLRQRCLAALARLASLLEARGDYAQAISHAERLLRLDPLQEEPYRLLMRLHDAHGDRARALRVYHVCTATLERELGVEPSAVTREAYEALLPPEREAGAAASSAGRVGGPPLGGRAAEWARLTALWRATEGGQAQFVLVTGEPGSGKTRLVEELRSWCAHRGAATAEARSYAAEGALAYGPVVAWLRSEALNGRLGRLDRARLTELARLLPELLSEVPDLPRPEPLPENDQRQRLFDALAWVILAPGAGGPLLLVADDLHWCDRATLQFLHYLLRLEPRARLLVAATARREEIDDRHPVHDLVAGLRVLACYTEIEVGRLTREETAALAERFGGYPLEAPDADRLYGETEGNPLFVIEALRAGWSRDQSQRAWLSPKVQAVIESRLAQLSGPARELVGVAATIGREFTSDALAAASDAGEETLVGGLDELWRRRIVREHGADAYDFSHGKIREAAYFSLSPARRRLNHLRVARALERLHSHDPGPVSGQLAAHYARAGASDQAVTWYLRAADAALHLHANAEAVRLLDRALEHLHTLPQTPGRDARELELLTALPAPLGVVEGWSSSRLGAVHRDAVALARALGVEPAPPLVRAMAIAGLSQGDLAGARRAGEQLRARAERDGDAVLVVEGQYVLGIAAFWQGELEAARGHFETAVARYRPEQHRVHVLRYGLDPKVICSSRLGNTLWLLGHPQEALRARDAALAHADEIGHPYTRAVALVFAALLALEMRDAERLRADVAALRSWPHVGEVPSTGVTAEALAGYVSVLDGEVEPGIRRIRDALEDPRGADHAPGMRGTILRVLLDACAIAGDASAGLPAADRALAIGGAARIWEAEVRRLRAELLAALGSPDEHVEAELDRALQVARRQGARLFELRVAASLLRQRPERGDGSGADGARELLAAIVAQFPGAHDTPDLREAAALLEQP